MNGASRWLCGSRAGAAAMVAAMAIACASPSAARAEDKSLIATMRIGDEIRYTFHVQCDETKSVKGRPSAGTETITTEDVGMVLRVKAVTTALNIVELTFESYKVSMDSGQGKVQIDLGGPQPDDKGSPIARDLYGKLHGLVGTVLTLNTAPGSGEITMFQGGEQLLASPGGPALRRYLDPDLFKSRFGTIFQLKSNSAMPQPGQPWYVQGHVFTFAHMAKTPVWETRTVEGMEADIAKVTGATHASGNPADAAKSPVFMKGVIADSVYKWDTVAGRLVSATRNEVINSSSERTGVSYDSDLVSKSTLELVVPAPKAKTSAPAAAKPDADGKHAP
jgi:hypothetical protein